MTTVLIVIFSVVVAVILAIIYGSGRVKNEAQDKVIDRILEANKIKKELDSLDAGAQRDRLRKYRK